MGISHSFPAQAGWRRRADFADVFDGAGGDDADGLAVDDVGEGHGVRRPPPERRAPVRDLEDLALERAPVGREALEAERLGRKRVIQRRFNVSVPRTRVPEKASMLRGRSER